MAIVMLWRNYAYYSIPSSGKNNAAFLHAPSTRTFGDATKNYTDCTYGFLKHNDDDYYDDDDDEDDDDQ